MKGPLRPLKRAVFAAKGALGARRRAAPPEEEVGPPVEAQGPEPPEWEYVPEGWERPVKGWDVEAVARAYGAKWPDYLAAIEAPNPLGVHHETAGVTTGDVSAHNVLVAFAYVVALAARGRNRLSVLDWGGGLGHCWALARSVVPGLELEYHVKETPAVCAQGNGVAPDVHFHEDDSCLDRSYDLVVASSSLQYAEDWRGLLDRLAGAAESHLYVVRVPVALSAPSFVVLQRAHAYGYETEYVGWILNRHEFLAYAAGSGVSLAREFLLDARFSAEGAPETPVEHRGFLFNR
ncbi:MAG: methyltransferase, TIGR04325 family [Verrucomicrobiota bacterium]